MDILVTISKMDRYTWKEEDNMRHKSMILV